MEVSSHTPVKQRSRRSTRSAAKVGGLGSGALQRRGGRRRVGNIHNSAAGGVREQNSWLDAWNRASRSRFGVRTNRRRPDQVYEASPSVGTPTGLNARRMVQARAVRLNSLRTLSRRRIRNAPRPIHCSMEPRGCFPHSWRRFRMSGPWRGVLPSDRGWPRCACARPAVAPPEFFSVRTLQRLDSAVGCVSGA